MNSIASALDRSPETFLELYDGLPFADVVDWISGGGFRDAEVRAALESSASHLDFEGFAALLSPAAAPFLEEQAQRARALTRMRFGKTVQIYAPMYLSNECASICTYCGFRRDNQIARLTLTPAKALAEADILYSRGIRHLLLLTGEDYRRTPVDYLEECVALLSQKFASISIEVYPLKQNEYERLRVAGLDGLAVYQETYDRDRYHEVHIGGMKKRLQYRLECPERAGRAGLRKLAIGALLGLSDPAAEVFFLGIHARFLMKRFWQTQLSISLPRLRPAAGTGAGEPLSDERFVQYLTALRLFLPDAGLTVSTRESATLRDNLVQICATSLSAGSRTDPGGYSGGTAGEQFSIEDHRSVAEVSAALRAGDLEPVFTDWAHLLK